MNLKIAVITGASKGIGHECAKLFLENNYIVVDASRSNPSPIDNENYHFVKTDIASEEEIKSLFEQVKEKFGRIDVLINNAGYGKFANMVDSTTSDFDGQFAVNVKGLYLCSRSALPMMIEQNSGTIINISSLAGKNPVPGGSIYSATKHAVMGFSKSLMLEVRTHGIRVVVVCPGSVDTDFFDVAGVEVKSKRSSLLTSKDVAKACLLAAELPPNANMSEIDLRPTNPAS